MTQYQRIFVAMLIGISGAAVMTAMTRSPVSIVSFGLLATQWQLLAGSFGGALLAGWLIAPLFGQPGRRGVWRAVTGASVSTMLGASLGSAATLLTVASLDALTGLVWGPLVVLDSLLRSGPVSLVWVLSMGMVHLLARRLPGAGSSRFRHPST